MPKDNAPNTYFIKGRSEQHRNLSPKSRRLRFKKKGDKTDVVEVLTRLKSGPALYFIGGQYVRRIYRNVYQIVEAHSREEVDNNEEPTITVHLKPIASKSQPSLETHLNKKVIDMSLLLKSDHLVEKLPSHVEAKKQLSLIMKFQENKKAPDKLTAKEDAFLKHFLVLSESEQDKEISNLRKVASVNIG